jgi:hypothetical protein
LFHCRLGEGCTHISGLLFALEANSTKQKEIPCTSKPCNWNKGGKRKKDSQEVSDIQFKKLKYGSEPCKPSNKKHIALPQTAAQDFFVSLTSKLSSSKSCPVLFDLLPNESNNNYDINDDLNVAHFQEVTTSESIKYDSDRFIDILSTIKRETIIDEQSVMELLSNIPSYILNEIEERTKGKADNLLWKITRQKRITSSNFHDIVVRKKENVEKLVSKFIQEDNGIETPALVYGRKHEPIARRKYIAFKKLKQNERVSVRECGIFICKKNGFLGASPDGLVASKSDTCREWVLEIKCPFKWRHRTIKDACRDKTFCCEVNNEIDIQLKKSHRYYSQVQGQMALCQCHKCDFVIYLSTDFLILEIDFDEDYWNFAESKLVDFYTKNIVPSILRD